MLNRDTKLRININAPYLGLKPIISHTRIPIDNHIYIYTTLNTDTTYTLLTTTTY